MRKSHADAVRSAEKLQRVDLRVSHGATVSNAIRASGVAKTTYYRWRRDFGHATSRPRPTVTLPKMWVCFTLGAAWRSSR
jgi:transposase-like protein